MHGSSLPPFADRSNRQAPDADAVAPDARHVPDCGASICDRVPLSTPDPTAVISPGLSMTVARTFDELISQFCVLPSNLAPYTVFASDRPLDVASILTPTPLTSKVPPYHWFWFESMML